MISVFCFSILKITSLLHLLHFLTTFIVDRPSHVATFLPHLGQYIVFGSVICKTPYKKAVLKKELLETRTKREIQFDKAVENIKRQIPEFQDYAKAIEIARKANEKYGSIPEAMVAIELIRLGYSIIPQQKINKYNVDFAIPKHKIIIEVDGKIFHSNDTKKEREAIIQLSVGIDWKIIHIPAEYIAKDIQKVEQIIKELSKALV